MNLEGYLVCLKIVYHIKNNDRVKDIDILLAGLAEEG